MSSKRLYKSLAQRVAHLVSSPVADAQSGIFAAKYLQKLVEESNSYVDITGLTEVLTPMKGFAAFSADAFTAGLQKSWIQERRFPSR